MKRGREVEDREVEELAMANCSKLLSRVGPAANLDGRVFECKTCNKKFPSSQALGGHRARHKLMPRSIPGDLVDAPAGTTDDDHRPKTTIKCSICGLEFGGGQALGCHMRRHRGNGSSVPAVIWKGSSNGGKRVLCLDLNLTPHENDLMFGCQIQTMAPLLVL